MTSETAGLRTPAGRLTADSIAARALYATGGNVVGGHRDNLTSTVDVRALFEEVRRWVAAIGATDLDTGRRVTKADALAVIDRVLAGLR